MEMKVKPVVSESEPEEGCHHDQHIPYHSAGVKFKNRCNCGEPDCPKNPIVVSVDYILAVLQDIGLSVTVNCEECGYPCLHPIVGTEMTHIVEPSGWDSDE